MKKILFGVLALGSVAMAAPALAQVSVDVPGFHAGVGDRYYHGDDWRFRHRHDLDSYNYYRGGCRDVTITHRDFNGDRVTRTERRCD
jgi:hypothetical protein